MTQDFQSQTVRAFRGRKTRHAARYAGQMGATREGVCHVTREGVCRDSCVTPEGRFWPRHRPLLSASLTQGWQEYRQSEEGP